MRRPEELIKDAEHILVEGNWEAASRVLTKAIKQISDEQADLKAKKTLSQALRLKAFADSRRGETQLAVAGATKALKLSVSLHDIEGEADALRRLGYIHWQKADYPMALEFYNTALEKANASDCKNLLGKIRVELANVYGSMGDTKMAMRVYKDALVILEEVQDYHDLGRVLNNMGSALMNDGKIDEAISHLKRCIQVCEGTGNIVTKSWALFNLGECHVRLGRPKDALPVLDQASKILAETDDKVGLTVTYLVYGMAHTGLKDWGNAQASFDRAFMLERKVQMPSIEGDIRREFGKMLASKGDKAVALKELNKALELFKNLANKKEAAKVIELIRAVSK